MSDEIELAKRAMACKGWRLMNGMRLGVPAAYPNEPLLWVRTIEIDYAKFSRLCPEWGRSYLILTEDLHRNALPDFEDPATLGCLLALVREAYDDPHAFVEAVNYKPLLHPERERVIWMPCGKCRFSTRGVHNTEADALVAALEAAP